MDFDLGGTGPIEAGLEQFVFFDKPFVGREALVRQQQNGPKRKLIGMIIDVGIAPLTGCRITIGGREVGRVTNGDFSYTLRAGIAMGYVSSEHADAEAVQVDVPGGIVTARVVKPPFYSRSSQEPVKQAA